MEDEITTPPTTAAEAAVAGTGSLLDQIRQRRDERVADESLVLPIPTWDGELLARYRVVDRKVIQGLARGVQKRSRRRGGDADDGGEADADFLIRACVEIIAHDNETEVEETIAEGYNQELAEALGINPGPSPARGVLFYLFKDNGIAVGAHAQKVAEWMTDTSKEVAGDLMGS